MDTLLPAEQACTVDMPEPQTPAKNLVQLVKQLIKEEQYEGVALLFTSETEAQRNLACLEHVGMDLLHDVCLKHLNEQNHSENMPLYGCAEELLKVIAAHANAEELLLELLELVEEQKSEYVFTSVLRAMQVVLLRLSNRKPRALEWSLNAIQSRLEELPRPEFLKEGYDQKQQALLEQNELIQSILMHYVTVGLFYEPILTEVTSTQRPESLIFRSCGIDRRNVLCCFLVQLLGKPLSLLDLHTAEDHTTNAYTVQCARNLTQAITRCIGDPFYLLALAGPRVRWKRRIDAAKGVYEMTSSNIFLIEEKLPLDALAIYIYMVLVEGVTRDEVPQVYAPMFVFEAGLYLATELLHHTEPALHLRGVLLGKKLLEQLHDIPIPSVSLELEVHKNFCHSLCQIVGYSSQVQLRQEGVQLLRRYIVQFDDEGKYLVLKNLLRSIGHTGISGYLAILYKDLVANALLTPTAGLPSSFSGQDFRSIFMHNICALPQGAETDLMEHSDKVISTLNALRFFAIKDRNNRTGFWDFIGEIEQEYLKPLRDGLDLSIAHYKAEVHRVQTGTINYEQLEMLDVAITNDKDSKVDLELDRGQKLQILNQNLCTFDLMRSLLARATECVEMSAKLYKSKKSVEQVCE